MTTDLPPVVSDDELSSELISHWQGIVDLMAELANVPSAIITRAEPPMIEVLRASDTPDNPYHQGLRGEMNGHYCQHVIESRDRLHVRDARVDPDWQHAPEVDYGVVAYLGYPLYWPDGEVFGTICILDRKGNEFGSLCDRLLQQFRLLVQANLALVRRTEELQASMSEVRTLRGILPICAKCKKIRDDRGLWKQMEDYVTQHSDAMFSHGLCPDCVDAMMPGS